MVMPALSTLLSNAPRERHSNASPVSSPIFFDDSHQTLVFFFGPGSVCNVAKIAQLKVPLVALDLWLADDFADSTPCSFTQFLDQAEQLSVHFICEAGNRFADVFVFFLSRILIYFKMVILWHFTRALLTKSRFFRRNLICAKIRLVGSMLIFSSLFAMVIRAILPADNQVILCLLANILSWLLLRTFILNHFRLIIAYYLLCHGARSEGLLILIRHR